jgi:hypothetical protein
VINPRNSHTPLPDDRRKRCPICRQTVYSSAGIHPQCAIKQADPWLPAPASKVEPPAEGVEAKPETPTPAPAVAAARVKIKPKPAMAAKQVKQA